jgi:hypothetical protein
MRETTAEFTLFDKVMAWSFLIVVPVAFMLFLGQTITWYQRYSCEHKLQMMGLKGTIPPYYRQCFVEFPDGTKAPLHQLRWNIDGKISLPSVTTD